MALQILDALDEIARRTYNTRYQIELLALRALLLDAQGVTGEAGTVLQQALDLARPGGFIRVLTWGHPCRPCCAALRSKTMRQVRI